MAPWLLAIISGQRRLVSVTLNANGTFTTPFGVSKVNLSGKGAAGTPAFSSTRAASAQGDSIAGHGSGSGASPGALAWDSFQDNSSRISQVNAGGTGSYFVVRYDGYPLSATYDTALSQSTFQNAVPGSASLFTSAGWKTSGAVSTTDSGFSLILYTQSYTVDATTGASTSAFSRTFAGGAGGPATVTTFNDVTVTENTPYPVVVPSGGSLTITYYQ